MQTPRNVGLFGFVLAKQIKRKAIPS